MENLIILHVSGDKWAASAFEQAYDAQGFYQQMVEEGDTRVSLGVADPEGNGFIEVEIQLMEFGPVDPAFLNYTRAGLRSWDDQQHTDFFQVKEYLLPSLTDI